MHPEAANFARWHLSRSSAVTLEIGARNVNGSIREMLKPTGVWVGSDLREGPGVDLVADACAEDFPARYRAVHYPADQLVCLETLEHVGDPEQLLRNLRDCAYRAALLVLTTAGPARAPHSGIDGGGLRAGEHYRNYTLDGLWRMLLDAGFEQPRVTPGRGELDLWALAWT